MATNMYLGIDPGYSSGHLAFLNCEGKLISLSSMPKDEVELVLWFEEHNKKDWCIHVCLENVHAMPGQGVSTMFKFGCNYGMLKMGMMTISEHWTIVDPRKWQKFFGLKRSKSWTDKEWKKHIANKARKDFPTQAKQIKDSAADAIMLARYCYLTNNGMTV